MLISRGFTLAIPAEARGANTGVDSLSEDGRGLCSDGPTEIVARTLAVLTFFCGSVCSNSAG
jgi:hypothetical protein